MKKTNQNDDAEEVAGPEVQAPETYRVPTYTDNVAKIRYIDRESGMFDFSLSGSFGDFRAQLKFGDMVILDRHLAEGMIKSPEFELVDVRR